MPRKWRSTNPPANMLPIKTSQSANAAPLNGCMKVVKSTQMNCIDKPMRADTGARRRIMPPLFHCCRAATSNARPATAKPHFPASHRTRSIASAAAVGTRIAASGSAGAVAASAATAMPDTAVSIPDAAKRVGTSGEPQPSRTTHVLERCQAPAINKSADASRAAPLAA